MYISEEDAKFVASALTHFAREIRQGRAPEGCEDPDGVRDHAEAIAVSFRENIRNAETVRDPLHVLDFVPRRHRIGTSVTVH